jgi:Type I phosphodiesterase / nucleotide pyrophosphatase
MSRSVVSPVGGPHQTNLARRMSRKSFMLFFSALLSLGALYSVLFWGRPVPFQVRVSEKLDSNGDGLIDTWHLTSPMHGKIVERDTNSDGRVDRLEFGNPETKVLSLSEASAPGSGRKLAVCLDGVPYDDMRALWEDGYFREFSRPGKLISVFPSLSDVALTDVLHAGKVPGYENLYFDVQRNRIAGGAASTVSKVRMPYLDVLDYDEPGIFKGLAYLLPVRIFHADLGRFLKRYSASRSPVYKSHVCSTDSVCHIMSREDFRKYLLEVDHLLRQIFIQQDGQVDFVVFSDHGNSQVTNRRVNLEGFLSQHGFRVESAIKDEKSVVVPGFGLVGAMAIYSQAQNTERLAELLPQMEGVDFATYVDRGAVRVVSATGSASIVAVEGGKRLKYQALQADPLALKPILETMSQRRMLDAEGYATSDAWFDLTAEHEYADAVNALYLGVTNHVSNRANVLVSFKDGYHYGSAFFEKLVTMRSTHGSLRRSSMTGFFMRNSPMPRRIMPSRELLKEF